MDARTDGTWRCSKAEVAGWDGEALDDSSWARAIEVGRHGDGPWGKIGGVGTAEAPCAAGVPGGVRMILVPSARAVTARGLESGKSYDALAFDAVTGGKVPVGTILADAAGTWTGRPPPGIEADWVLILEPAGAPAGAPAKR